MGTRCLRSLSWSFTMLLVIFVCLFFEFGLCCPALPIPDCAQVFDSQDCSGGWYLPLSNGQRVAFDGPVFSNSWWFRNDIDRVAVGVGCNLTMWSEDNFTGIVKHWNNPDRWLVLEFSDEYKMLHENINSMECECHARDGHTYSEK